MSTLPGLRVNYARILTHYMTFTLKQQGEVLKNSSTNLGTNRYRQGFSDLS